MKKQEKKKDEKASAPQKGALAAVVEGKEKVSAAEIAEKFGVSRQAVYDALKSSSKKLVDFTTWEEISTWALQNFEKVKKRAHKLPGVALDSAPTAFASFEEEVVANAEDVVRLAYKQVVAGMASGDTQTLEAVIRAWGLAQQQSAACRKSYIELQIALGNIAEIAYIVASLSESQTFVRDRISSTSDRIAARLVGKSLDEIKKIIDADSDSSIKAVNTQYQKAISEVKKEIEHDTTEDDE